MITSSSNQKMKQIIQLNKKAKTRYEQRVFVAEGLKLCMEAPGEDILAMYVSESFLEGNQEKLKGFAYEVVTDSVFRGISDTKTPQGILCLVKMMEYTLDDLLGSNAHLLILEGIQDPGNLGTILRLADWFGVKTVFAGHNTVDIFNPKTIIASMGSVCRVKVIQGDLKEILSEAKRLKIPIWGTFLEGLNIFEISVYTNPSGIIVMGNEGNGISDEISAFISHKITIPSYPPERLTAESLNVAMATAITLSEFRRRALEPVRQ